MSWFKKGKCELSIRGQFANTMLESGQVVFRPSWPPGKDSDSVCGIFVVLTIVELPSTCRAPYSKQKATLHRDTGQLLSPLCSNQFCPSRPRQISPPTPILRG